MKATKDFGYLMVNEIIDRFSTLYSNVPGMKMVCNYIVKSYQNDPGRYVRDLNVSCFYWLGFGLVLAGVWLVGGSFGGLFKVNQSGNFNDCL
jgi:hypothetical protein